MNYRQISGADDYVRPQEGTAIFPWEKRNTVLDHIAKVFVEQGFDDGNKLAYWYGLQVIADLSVAHSDEKHLEAGLQRFIDAWHQRVALAFRAAKP